MKAIFVGGLMNRKIIDTEEAISNGLVKLTGYTKDWTLERERGLVSYRAELDNQPKFEGYLGPMWDGDKLRYETLEVYNSYWS